MCVFIESSAVKPATDHKKKTIPPKSKDIGIAGIDSMIEKIKSGKFATAEEKSEKISDEREKNPEVESSDATSVNTKPTSARDPATHTPKPANFAKKIRFSRSSIRFIIFCANSGRGSGASKIDVVFLWIFMVSYIVRPT